MSSKIIFNLALLPEDEFSERLEGYSQNLKGIRKANYFLGVDSLPHVTLLQFEEFESKAKDLWDLVMHLDAQEIDYRGLSIERWGNLDCVWLRIARKRNLERLQEEAIASLKKSNLTYLNGVEEEFEPHSTLAAWSSLGSVPALPIDPGLLGARNIKTRLALGKSGPTYQFARKLFSHELSAVQV